VPCRRAGRRPVGLTCQTAMWGPNVDSREQQLAHHGVYERPDGLGPEWRLGRASTCPTAAAPEHVLVNFHSPWLWRPLSALLPPGFLIGPNPGQCGHAFRITPVPVRFCPRVDGSGSFETARRRTTPRRGAAPVEYDFGDAPDSYVTKLPNGARHYIVSGAPWLGDATDTPDADADGQPNANATGDDLTSASRSRRRRDGVTIPVLTVGQSATIGVLVGSPGWVDA